MLNKEGLLRLMEGKSDEEIKQILEKNYGINWSIPEGACKAWFAKVFIYCSTREFEEELDFFFFLVNTFSHLFHVCFKHEDTIFLGCTCPCGNKEVILYYSLTRGD